MAWSCASHLSKCKFEKLFYEKSTPSVKLCFFDFQGKNWRCQIGTSNFSLKIQFILEWSKNKPNKLEGIVCDLQFFSLKIHQNE